MVVLLFCDLLYQRTMLDELRILCSGVGGGLLLRKREVPLLLVGNHQADAKEIMIFLFTDSKGGLLPHKKLLLLPGEEVLQLLEYLFVAGILQYFG